MINIELDWNAWKHLTVRKQMFNITEYALANEYVLTVRKKMVNIKLDRLFTFFGLLSSSLSPCLSLRFGRCTLRPSSGGWNVELNTLFRLPG